MLHHLILCVCFLISNRTHVNKKFQQGINSMGPQDDLSNGTSQGKPWCVHSNSTSWLISTRNWNWKKVIHLRPKPFVPAIKLDFLYCKIFDQVSDFAKGTKSEKNIIQFRFCFGDKIWTKICFCFCFCPFGEIRNSIKIFTKEEIYLILLPRQNMAGIWYLHEKVENCFLRHFWFRAGQFCRKRQSRKIFYSTASPPWKI